MTDLHVIITEAGEGFGWTFESPQLPGLIGGRNTSTEVIADFPEIVNWAKDADQTFDRVFAHEQHLVLDPNGNEYLIRFHFSGSQADYDARHETAGRLNYAVLNGLADDEELERHVPITATQERLFIAVLDTDTIGWLEDQLLEREDCCVVALSLGNGAIVHMPFAVTKHLPGGFNMEAVGLARESTVAEMMDAVLHNEIDTMKRTISAPRAITEFALNIEDRQLTST